MTSLSRKMNRAACRRSGIEYNRKDRIYIMDDNGGYDALHPTRGWRHISEKRLSAQRKMAEILHPKYA